MVPSSFLRLLMLPLTLLLPVLAKLDQTAQLPGLTFNLSTPRPADTVETLSQVPVICAKYTGAGKECPTTMTAVNVTYADCGTAWTLCHCPSANITLDAAVDFLAHVPVGLRRYVGTIMVMPGTSAHAYTLAGDIHYFGICSQRTWIHESSHATDGALKISQGGANGTLWAEAVGNDTCVPDTYAQTNLVENFAQMSVVEGYRLLNGQLPPGISADCMSHQLAYVASLPLYDASTLLGDTCAFEPQLAQAQHTLAPSLVSASTVADLPNAASSESPKPTGAASQIRTQSGLELFIALGVLCTLIQWR